MIDASSRASVATVGAAGMRGEGLYAIHREPTFGLMAREKRGREFRAGGYMLAPCGQSVEAAGGGG